MMQNSNDPGNIQTPSPFGGNGNGNGNNNDPGNIQTPSPFGGPDGTGNRSPRDSNSEGNTAEFIVGNISLIIGLFLILLLALSMVIKYFQKNGALLDALKKGGPGRPLLVLLIITISTFLIVPVMVLTLTIEDLFSNTAAIAGTYFSVVSRVTICYRVGRLSMTSLFLFRLHISFKGSAMEISTKKIIVPLAFCAILSFITGSIGSILGLAKVSDAFIGPTHTVAALRCAAFAVDLVTNSLILWLFIHKLWSITLMGANELTLTPELTMKNVDSETIQNKIKESSTINQQQVMFLRTMTKNTNLAIWGIVSSLIPETVLVTAAFLTMNGDRPDVDGLVISVLFVIDGVINSFCAYLLFSYAKKEYRWLCRYCDKGLSRCCTYLMQRRVARSQMHQFEEMHAEQIRNSMKMKQLSPRLIDPNNDGHACDGASTS